MVVCFYILNGCKMLGAPYNGPLNGVSYDVKSGVLDLYKQRLWKNINSLGGLSKFSGKPLDYRVFFGNFWLNDNENYFISDVGYLDSRQRYYDYQIIGNRGYFYGEKRTKGLVKVKGYVKADNRVKLLKKIEYMKNRLLLPTYDIDIDTIDDNESVVKKLIVYDKGYGRFVYAICNKIDFIENRYNVNWMDFEIIFEYIDVWKEIKNNVIYYDNIDNLDEKIWIDTKEDTPAIIYFRNNTQDSNVEIEINGKKAVFTCKAGKLYKYNSYTCKIVDSGGAIVNYDGFVSDFKPGINNLKISFNGLAKVIIIYNKVV